MQSLPLAVQDESQRLDVRFSIQRRSLTLSPYVQQLLEIGTLTPSVQPTLSSLTRIVPRVARAIHSLGRIGIWLGDSVFLPPEHCGNWYILIPSAYPVQSQYLV